jgi:D-3-phosphoglycerate dehydrogenase / 2-oxoglutarate reductase
MDVLIVEPLEPEVLQWIDARHPVRFAPQFERDTRALREAMFNVRALIAPPSVALDAQSLRFAPVLRAVGRLSSGVENLDAEAFARAGVEIVRPGSASAGAEAEFAIGSMLQLLRRVPVSSSDGMLVGRELAGATVGLVGLPPAARPLAALLGGFGATVKGYDPALHMSDALWASWKIEPVGLPELVAQSDVLCVLLNYFTRYKGLIGERLLPDCKPNQVLVSLAHSSLFDDEALAAVLESGRMAAAWFDSMEPSMLDFGRPLRRVRNLQITPRVASTTRESRIRSAWSVVRRIDEILGDASPRPEFRATIEDDALGLEAGRASA